MKVANLCKAREEFLKSLITLRGPASKITQLSNRTKQIKSRWEHLHRTKKLITSGLLLSRQGCLAKLLGHMKFTITQTTSLIQDYDYLTYQWTAPSLSRNCSGFMLRMTLYTQFLFVVLASTNWWCSRLITLKFWPLLLRHYSSFGCRSKLQE